MNKTIYKKRVLLLLASEVFFLFLTIGVVIFSCNSSSMCTFLLLSKYGTAMCIAFTVILCLVQRSVFSIVNLVYISFWIFQFGLPICYAIIKGYSNFYINLFDARILVRGCQYSIFAIEIFAIAITITFVKHTNRKIVFDRCAWIKDANHVEKIGMFIFFATVLIELPLMIYAAYATKAYGFFSANTRSYLSSNAFFRAIQAFCVPSGLMVMIYTKSRSKEKIVKAILCIISALQLVAGDRTNGLSCLLAIAYYHVFGSEISARNLKKQIAKQIKFGIVLCMLMIVLVYVAVARVSTTSVSIGKVISEDLIGRFLAELGLNFTTICFVMKYIPLKYKFRLGMTYLGALVCIIPKSIDPTGLVSFVGSFNPELWLFNANHAEYGSLLDFGVGFSLIGESYMNFAWFGLAAVFIIALIIMKFISVDYSNCSPWGKYVQLVLLIDLMTFSRRGFYDLVKDIEYSVFIMAFLLWGFYLIKHKKRG